MGIGEPLYGQNVIRAIQSHSPYVRDTRFSLSTIGAEGTIDKLTRADLPFPTRLELSLHHSNDAMRRRWLIPRQELFKNPPNLRITLMLEEAERYAQKHPGKVTLNYALIDGINNGDKNIDELHELLRNRTDIFYVKVMYPNITSSFVFSWRNESHPFGLERKSTQFYTPEEFRVALEKSGIPATLFKSAGTDISAGCGMMSSRFNDMTGVIDGRKLKIPQADPSKLGFK